MKILDNIFRHRNLGIEKHFRHEVTTLNVIIYLITIFLGVWAQLNWHEKHEKIREALRPNTCPRGIDNHIILFVGLWALPKLLLSIRRFLLSGFINTIAQQQTTEMTSRLLENGETILNNHELSSSASLNVHEAGTITKITLDNMLAIIIPDSLDLIFGSYKFLRVFPSFTVTYLATLIIYIFIDICFGKIVKRNLASLSVAMKNHASLVNLSPSEIKVILLNNYSKQHAANIEKSFSILNKLESDKIKFEAVASASKILIVGIFLFIVGWRTAKGDDSTLFGWAVGLTNYIIWPMIRLSTSIPELVSGFHSLKEKEMFFDKIAAQGRPTIAKHSHLDIQAIEAIEFKNLSYSVGDRVIIDDFSLKMTKKSNRLVLLSGENGSGKSTILDLLVGIKKPTEGSISITYKDSLGKIKEVTVNEENKYIVRELVGIMTQEATNLFGGKRYNLFSNASLNRRTNSVIAEIYDEIPDFEPPTSPRILSGGQAQKLSFCRLLHQDKPIVVMDEGTSAQDSASRKIFDQIIKKISGNKFIIRITHDSEETAALLAQGYHEIKLVPFAKKQSIRPAI